MKKLFVILSFVLLMPVFAQDLKIQIETQFNDYNKLLVEKHFEKALSLYANENYLKAIPKKQLVALMNEMFNSQDIDFILEKPQNIKVSSEIVEQNGEKFVEISYQQNFEMKFNDVELSKYALFASLKNEFGNDNVAFDNQTGYFLISTNKVAVANSNDSINWKFSVLEKKAIPILKQFIPEQFLKNLK